MLHDRLDGCICDIIRRDVDCLERGDGTVPCGVDTLLDLADIRVQSRRISVLDRHTVFHGADLGIGLYGTVDIVDK